MSRHLLLVTLGPVQEFIAQARRTRDLWFGSHLLSEISRTAARGLVNRGANLIFPALDTGDAELQSCLAPLRTSGQAPLNIANKIVAVLPAHIDPAQLATDVREQVFKYWRDDIAAAVKTKCGGLLPPNIDAVWAEQIGTFLEFVASWAPLDDFGQARRAVERAVAGRKNLRDFRPWFAGRGGEPKSSLDGARETVLRPADKGLRFAEKRDGHIARRYRILDNEQLDAVGLVKRAGGEPDQFVPIVNIALASWVTLADSAASSELQELYQACRDSSIAPVRRSDLAWTEALPFDASVLFPSRWKSVFEEQGIAGDAAAWGRDHVQPLLRKLTEPYPYVACLVADGDRMGAALDSLAGPQAREGDDPIERHRGLSRALAKFSVNVRTVVERDHSGVLVYSGGDDVLAFLPIPQVLACTESLRKAFYEAVSRGAASLPPDRLPTLSIGIGIGHVMEGMGDLLALGREAEREAKRERNSLAVLVDMRSGGRRSWSAKWDTDPAGSVRKSIQHLDELLPTGKVYEIATVLGRLPRKSPDAQWAAILTREVERALFRVGEGSLTSAQVDLDLNAKTYIERRQRVEDWVNRVLIARVLARSVPSQRPRAVDVGV